MTEPTVPLDPAGPMESTRTPVGSEETLGVGGDDASAWLTGGRRRLLVAAGTVLGLLVAATAWAVWPSPKPDPVLNADKTVVAPTSPSPSPSPSSVSPTVSASSSPTPAVTVATEVGGSSQPRPQPPAVNNPPPGITVPAMPTLYFIAQYPGTYSYQFTWIRRSHDEQGFTVYFDDGQQVTVGKTDYYVRHNLAPDTRICFAVSAYNAAGHSPVTDWMCATTPPLPPPPPTTPPAAPSNMRYSLAGGSSLNLAWTDNSHDEASFELRTTRGGVASSESHGSNSTTAGRTLTQDRGVEYCYDVRAHNVAGASAWSNVVCVSFELAPAAPTNLQVTFVGSAVHFEWVDNSHNEANFQVVVRSQVQLLLIRSVAADTTSTDWLTAPLATSMCARVTARNDGGNSPASNEVCFTTPEASPSNDWASSLTY